MSNANVFFRNYYTEFLQKRNLHNPFYQAWLLQQNSKNIKNKNVSGNASVKAITDVKICQLNTKKLKTLR